MTLKNMLKDIQKKLKAPKSQYNKFGNYYYRNCEDIFEAVKPLLDDAIITVTDKIVKIGDRYYVKATATYKSKTEKESVSAYAREENEKKGMSPSQLTGSTSSYARKYALNGLLLIDDTKDADTPSGSPTKPPKKAPKTSPAETPQIVKDFNKDNIF